MIQQIQGGKDVGDDDIAGLHSLGGSTLSRHDADAEASRLQHEGVVGALADGDNGSGAEAADVGLLLSRLIPRREAFPLEIELLVDDRLPAMCIGGEQVDRETIAQGGDTLGDAVDEDAIQGERAVDVGHKVLEAKGAAAGDGELDHHGNYTVDAPCADTA